LVKARPIVNTNGTAVTSSMISSDGHDTTAMQCVGFIAVCEKRQIADDKCVVTTADYRLAVMKYVVDCYRHSRGVPENHHTEGVADQK